MAKPRRKYRNQPVICPETGEKFDSKGEYNRWLYLQWEEKQGLISDLTRQVSYPLCAVDGSTVVAHIQPDFDYKREGQPITEDFKSPATMTSVFKLKAKMFATQYGRPIEISSAKGARR